MKPKIYILSVFVFILTVYSCGQKIDGPPYSPEEALSTFQIADGFKIELVASEPLIKDPTEIAFDENGKMYVAQMQDYPSDGAPICNIMLLEDKDNDGYYEEGTVFAENLAYVNGVMPWKKGVLVTSAPDIFYMEDTDGDGSADIKDVVLTGFAVTNPQLRMSSLRYGLDNWIYGAYSRSGGNGRYPEFSDKGSPLNFPSNSAEKGPDIYPGTDFRFIPNEYKVEPSGGMSQFGLSFDAVGNRFTVWNNAHLRHVVIDARYLERNPFLSINTVMASLPEHGDAAPVFPITQNKLDLHESEIGHFTSACGNTIYTGNLFGGLYKDASFVCEPVSNLVHVDFLNPKDATFVGKRDQPNSEFLSSTDSWFRPVNSTIGPDGALYIVDFYRKLVEHPAWIARANEEGIFTHAGILQESDFLEGKDKGRVYRIVPDNYKREGVKQPALSKATTKELVGHLDHPNRWWRINSQRLIVDREDANSVDLIEKLIQSKPSSLGKIHALWTLHALNELDNQSIIDALKDEDPVVRKQAVLLTEDRLSNKDIQNGLLTMESDPDAHVQFQFALTASAIPDITIKPLLNIAKQYMHDSWFQSAVLLAAKENPLSFYTAIFSFTPTDEESIAGKYLFLEKNSSIIGAMNNGSQIVQLLKLIEQSDDENIKTASLKGLEDGLKRISGPIMLSQEGQNSLIAIITKSSPTTQNEALKLASRIRFNNSLLLRNSINNAINVAGSRTAVNAERIVAIKTLGLDPNNGSIEIFEDLLSPEQSSFVQKAAVEVLIGKKNEKANELLLSNWDHYTLSTRAIVETGFLNDQTRLKLLIEALKAEKVKPDWLSKTSRTRLIEHADPKVREVAKNVFKNIPPDDREEILTDYYETTTAKGNIEKGKVIFKSACSACHLLEGVGNNFGPDLLSVSHQTRVNLLTMILNPNHNIAPGYEGYMIEDKEGQTFAGIIVSENTTGVILRSAGGTEQTILRKSINSVIPMNNSLMPEGLEVSIKKDQMVDLLEYLKTLGQ